MRKHLLMLTALEVAVSFADPEPPVAWSEKEPPVAWQEAPPAPKPKSEPIKAPQYRAVYGRDVFGRSTVWWEEVPSQIPFAEARPPMPGTTVPGAGVLNTSSKGPDRSPVLTPTAVQAAPRYGIIEGPT